MFTKESNLNKAREHSLLVSKRPPYVTILTLVRDAAARLPNGEGTRAEVCLQCSSSLITCLYDDYVAARVFKRSRVSC